MKPGTANGADGERGERGEVDEGIVLPQLHGISRWPVIVVEGHSIRQRSPYQALPVKNAEGNNL
jgi:hypothetical protein